jgi:hypothetical protein
MRLRLLAVFSISHYHACMTSGQQPPAAPPIRPLWLRHLDRVRRELHETVWPASPDEGLRQTLALADLGWRQVFDRLRRRHPHASDHELQARAYRDLCRWQRVRDRLKFRLVS